MKAIEHLKIEGLKGPERSFELGPLTLVTGPNGAGKSSIGDAIRFLVGQETAGVGAEGPALRAALAGDRLLVEARAGGRVLARERTVKGKTFSRSTATVDGEPGDPSSILGALPPVGGREILGFSEEKLLAAVAVIGAATAPPEIVEGLLSAVEAYQEGALLEKIEGRERGDTVAILESAAAAARREHLDRKKAVSAAEAAAEKSRRELGGAAVEPGTAAAAAAAAEKAIANVDESARRTAKARAELTEARRALSATERELQALRAAAGGGGEDLAALRRALEEARGEAATKEAQERTLRASSEAAAQAAEEAVAAAEELEARRAELARRRNALAERASMIEHAPCSAADDWISAAAQAEDPFTEPVDLCDGCPFTAEAIASAREIPAIDQEGAALGPEIEKASAAAAAAEEKAEKAGKAYATVSSQTTAAREKVADLDRRTAAAAAKGGAPAERIAELEGEAARLTASISDLELEETEAAASEAGARQRLEALRKEEREASIAEERLRRLHSDREALSVAEACRDEAKELEERAGEARAALRAEGERTIESAARGFLPPFWRVAFEGGAVGLSDGRSFWSGAGLSAAQAEALRVALDCALAEIYGAGFRLLHIEADPLDEVTREHLLSGAEAALSEGRISQVVVCSWHQIERPGWHSIQIAAPEGGAEADPFAAPEGGAEADPFAAPEEVAEVDPFAAPEEVAEADPFAAPDGEPEAAAGGGDWIEEAEGPELRDVLKALGAKRVPRRITDRRELLHEMLPEFTEAQIAAARAAE